MTCIVSSGRIRAAERPQPVEAHNRHRLARPGASLAANFSRRRFRLHHTEMRWRRSSPTANLPFAMKVFLVFVNDENFYRLLPEELGGSKQGDSRIKVMGFPPLGIETLAPVLRKHGHQVRMFDTCHPNMKEADVAEAVRADRPDAIAISFLSTTTYPGAKSM